MCNGNAAAVHTRTQLWVSHLDPLDLLEEPDPQGDAVQCCHHAASTDGACAAGLV